MEASVPVARSNPSNDGFLAVEGTPALGKALSFAGLRGNEGLGRFIEGEGKYPALRAKDRRRKQGCSSWLMEEGNLANVDLRKQAVARRGPSLDAGSARAVQRCRPRAIVANGGPVGASPASGVAIGRWLSWSCLAASLQPFVEPVAKGLSRFVALLMSSSKGEVRPSGNGKAKGSAASRVAAKRRSSRGVHESRMLAGAFARPKSCSCRS